MVAGGNWFLVTGRACCFRRLIKVVVVRQTVPERLGAPRSQYAEIRAMCGLFANWRARAPLDDSEFKRALYAGKVREVTLTEQQLAGTLIPDGLNTVLGDERAGQGSCAGTPSAVPSSPRCA